MISGKTSSGFEFEVNGNVVDDWRVVKAIAKTQKKGIESTEGAVDLVELILGTQEDALCEHVAAEDGTVSTSAIMTELTEIITIAKSQSDAVKN